MSKRPLAKLNLHNFLEKGSFEHAVLCTFTFDPIFFEDYALENFDPLAGSPNISVLIDQTTYAEMLNDLDADLPKLANIRYFLYPVHVPGKFHPKLYLFANKRKGKLVVGSANFTRSGITENAELVGAFEYEEEKNEKFKQLFQDSYRYLKHLADRSNSPALRSNIAALGREVDWIQGSDGSSGNSVFFLNNLEEPLWNQILSLVEPPVDTVDVLSIFFGSEPTLIDKVFSDLRPKRMRIFTENGRTTLTESWLNHRLVKNGQVAVIFVSYKAQPLHAKAIFVGNEGRGTLIYGSANFTSSALIRSAKNGNSEIVLLLQDLTDESLSSDILFDPGKTARVVRDSSELSTREQEIKKNLHEVHLLHLQQAEIVEERIRLDIEVPESVTFDSLRARIVFNNGLVETIPVVLRNDREYGVKIAPKHRKLLDDGSAVVEVMALIGDEEVASSNRVLVINLREFRTGVRLRPSRYVKEAQENVDQFLQVLIELLGGSDENVLRTFFSLCDIPILEASRPPFFRRDRPQWDGGEGMRSFGKKNLEIYTELHDAAIAFFDRHSPKLHQHVEFGSVNGASNYLHIFFAMGGVLRAQLERLIQGLESQDKPVSVHTWGEARKHIDEYYYRARDLFECLDDEYLPKLAKSCGWDKVQNVFRDELNNLDDLRLDLLIFRERLEEIRGKSLWIKGASHKKNVPGYFECIFKNKHWERFTNTLDELKSRESELIA